MLFLLAFGVLQSQFQNLVLLQDFQPLVSCEGCGHGSLDVFKISLFCFFGFRNFHADTVGHSACFMINLVTLKV